MKILHFFFLMCLALCSCNNRSNHYAEYIEDASAVDSVYNDDSLVSEEYIDRMNNNSTDYLAIGELVWALMKRPFTQKENNF